MRRALTVAMLAAIAVVGMLVNPGHAADGKHVVVIGVPGLRWSDVKPETTPALWRLTGEGGAAALSVRTATSSTCPIDSWLTLSAGQRAKFPGGNCGLPPAPFRSGEGATAPSFAAVSDDNESSSYEARIGQLGASVHGAQGCTMAVGPGAVYGAADATGRVDVYAPNIERVPDWSRCALAVADINNIFRSSIEAGVDANGVQVPVSARRRASAANRADSQVGQILSAVPPGTTVLIAGLSGADSDSHLQVALATGPSTDGPYEPTYLSASSTRRRGLVTLTDLTTTALEIIGIDKPEKAVGALWENGAARPSVADTVRELDEQDVAAQTYRRLGPPFWPTVAILQLIWYLIAALVLRRRWGDTPVRRRVLVGTRVVALAAATMPISTFLANVVPWWSFDRPALVLFASMFAAVGLCTGLALAGPWRRSVVTSGIVIAGLTAIVLALDVMTGSRLQMCSFAGYSPIVAGRFYGFSNMAFAVFATASILSGAWLAGRAYRAYGKRAAVAVVLAIGAAAVAVDGWPTWGADFGGVIAIVAATAVLALMVAEQRISARWLAGIAAAAVVAAVGLSFVDSLRANPTHLGEFWDQLLDGEAWTVIARKFGSMVRSLRWLPFTLVTIGGLSFMFFVLNRPLSWRAAALAKAYEHAPMLRPALIATLVVAFTGMLVNDSGVIIATLSLILAVPLALAACVRALELDGEGSPRSEPPAARSAPTA